MNCEAKCLGEDILRKKKCVGEERVRLALKFGRYISVIKDIMMSLDF